MSAATITSIEKGTHNGHRYQIVKFAHGAETMACWGDDWGIGADGPDRWSVSCVKHGYGMEFSTYSRAKEESLQPGEWCTCCAEEIKAQAEMVEATEETAQAETVEVEESAETPQGTAAVEKNDTATKKDANSVDCVNRSGVMLLQNLGGSQMSKATNNTQRVTFGKVESHKRMSRSFTPVLLDGVQVGRIEKNEYCHFTLVDMTGEQWEDVAVVISEKPLVERFCKFTGGKIESQVVILWQAARKEIKAAAIAHFTPTEEPAQAETVEVEIPAFKGAVVVPVMANGEKVGHITQVQNEIYAGVAGYRVTVGETQGVFFKTARAAKAAAQEMAIAHCAQAETVKVEEPAQVETVEVEEAAQPMANEDGESVSLECPACDRVVATVTPANVGPSSYTRTCKCGRRTRHDVILTITQDDRIRVARWGMLATNVGYSKRQWVQTDRGMKWMKVFVPAEAHA